MHERYDEMLDDPEIVRILGNINMGIMNAAGLKIRRTTVRRLWFPYRGAGARWLGRGLVLPPPRLVQLLRLAHCRLAGHDWGRWRVEDELDGFHYVVYSEPYSMRGCKRHCGTIERVVS